MGNIARSLMESNMSPFVDDKTLAESYYGNATNLLQDALDIKGT